MPDSITPFIETGEATAILPLPNDKKPVTVIGTEAIRETFDEGCVAQAINSAMAPGVSHLVLNPDAHVGYGAPVGCVMASPSHIYPGPVGVDIKCSMSLLSIDVDESAVVDARTRRALIDAICERTPTGTGRGQRHAAKSRRVDDSLGVRIITEGASVGVCEELGIPPEWADRCEDSSHTAHDGSVDSLITRLEVLKQNGKFRNKLPGKIQAVRFLRRRQPLRRVRGRTCR